MFGPVSSHLLSIVPGTPWNHFSGPPQFPNQHPSQKTWLWSTLLSNLCGAITANTVNHCSSWSYSRWGRVDFWLPTASPLGQELLPLPSVPRQTFRAAPHQAEDKPLCSDLPKLRRVSCHRTALQPDSSRSASSTHKRVNFPVLLHPALFTNSKKN